MSEGDGDWTWDFSIGNRKPLLTFKQGNSMIRHKH